ncbi:unnamed protein product, partial [Callosobruchus maculatus]
KKEHPGDKVLDSQDNIGNGEHTDTFKENVLKYLVKINKVQMDHEEHLLHLEKVIDEINHNLARMLSSRTGDATINS